MTINSTHAQPTPDLYRLITSKNLHSEFDSFMLSCRVDNLAPATLRYYRQFIGALVNELSSNGIRDAADIKPEHLRLYFFSLQQRIKPISCHSHYRAARRFFNWLLQEGIILSNPMKFIRAPKYPRTVIQPFNQSHIQKMLAICDVTRFLGIRDRAIVLTFYDTGLRLSELSLIQLTDIDVDHDTIKVLGKGSKERTVWISKETLKAIIVYVQRRTDTHPCLWVSEERTPLTRDGVYRVIQRLGHRAGITNVRCSPHTFRHTFGTMSLALGADRGNVQRLLGHETEDMTRRYTQTILNELAIKAQERYSPVDHLLGKKKKSPGV